MDPLYANVTQISIPKHLKVHRSRPQISRKIVAFQELINLEHNKKSAREAANLIGVPNSTMQSWRKQIAFQEECGGLAEFLTTPTGVDFLQRNTIAVIKLMKCGSSGIRGVQEYLHNSGLDKFVASSEGALQDFWVRCETCILEFGEREEKRLALGMRQRRITAGLDEMFRSRRPCLVAMDVVSNYILLEKFTEDRTAETWTNELKPRLAELNIELGQVVSDLCGGIRAATKKLGAIHIPELFHAQYEISKATGGALSAQEREFERLLSEDEEKVRKVIEKHGEESDKAKEIIVKRNLRRIGLEMRKDRSKKVRTAKKELGKIHHPIDLKSGKLQSAEIVKNKFDEQLNIIDACAKDACLSQSSIKRLEKARRAFDAIVGYVVYFFIVYAAYVRGLNLGKKEEVFFNEVIFPLSYLTMIWKRLSKEMKKELGELKKDLEARVRDAPWPEEIKNEWMKKGRELAETFQRSSSCVEGRNGVLSLNHHRYHRLNIRGLRVLTIVHNFDIRRPDGTTAAKRLFEAEHDNLFESLVANVRIPGKPQQQYHEEQKRKLGWEKRLAKRIAA